MEKYNYKEALKQDILNYIKDNDILSYPHESAHELHGILMDALWPLDEITGNGGSYYDTAEKCEEYLAGNIRLIIAALADFNYEYESFPDNDDELIQSLDATVRCYLLWECIWDALKELGMEEDY